MAGRYPWAAKTNRPFQLIVRFPTHLPALGEHARNGPLLKRGVFRAFRADTGRAERFLLTAGARYEGNAVHGLVAYAMCRQKGLFG